MAPALFARGQAAEQTPEERLAGEAAQIAEEYGRDPEDFAGLVRDEAAAVVEDEEHLPAAVHVFDIVADRYRQYIELGEQAHTMLNQLFDREISQTLTEEEINAIRQSVIETLDAMQLIIPFPSEYQQRTVDDLTFLLQLALDTARHDALMDRALAILHPTDGSAVVRSDAIDIYSDDQDSSPGMNDAAMTLQIQYYDPARYGSVVAGIIQSVKDSIRNADRVVSGTDDQPGLEQLMMESAREVVALFQGSSGESAATEERQVRFDEFLDLFTRANAVSRDISEAADLLDAQIAVIAPTWPTTGNKKDDFHLLFIQDYLRGRDNVAEDEGMVYAMDSLVGDAFEMVSVPAEIEGRESYERALAGLAAADVSIESLNQEARLLDAARADQVLQLVVNGIVVRAGQPATGIETPEQYAEILSEDDAISVMGLLARIRSASLIPAVLNTFRNAVFEYQRGGTSIATLRLRRTSVQNGADTLERQLTEWGVEVARFTAVGDVASTMDTTGVLDYHSASIAARIEQLHRLEIDLVDRVATLEFDDLSRTYRGRSAAVPGAILADVENANGLIVGFEEDGWQKKSPDRAEAILTTAQQQLTSLIADLRQYEARYGLETERSYVASAASIVGHVQAAVDLEAQVNATAARVRQLLAQARSLQQTARSAERSADAALQSAKDLIAVAEASSDPFEVEQSISDAENQQADFLTSYRASLDAWWREPQYERWEREREALALLIGEAQRLLVRAQVQTDIQTAENLYDQERYEEAIVILSEARDQWNNVFEDANALLEVLLNRARNAATLTENIEIDLSEPDAQQNQLLLERALQLEERARSTTNMAAREALVSDARALLDELFEDQPRNLEGRIAQIRLSFLVADDPNVEISRRVADLQEAFAGLSDPLRDDQRQEALRDLTQAQAVQQVISDRPEVDVEYRTAINRLVDRLELLLNPPPVTDDRQINAILTQAYRLLSLTPGQVPETLPPLTESVYDTVSSLLASGLGLEGARIGELRALYQLVIASGAIQTWRPEAEARFQEAQSAFRSNDIPTAVRLMEGLWEDDRVHEIDRYRDFYNRLRELYPELFRSQ